MKQSFRLLILALVVLSAGSAQAQWVTQSFELKEGWNAIYLHVDASYTTLEHLVPYAEEESLIEEIWIWKSNPSAPQFIESPLTPTRSIPQWDSWKSQGDGFLQRLVPNTAYLVKAKTATTWEITGQPVPPRYQWTSTGLNLIGFSAPETNFLSLRGFMGNHDGLASAGVFFYDGGEIADNPKELADSITRPLARGEAFWVDADGQYNDYFGAFDVELANRDVIDFQDGLGQTSFRLKNRVNSKLKVTMTLKSSVAAPSIAIGNLNVDVYPDGFPEIAGLPTLLVRGELDPKTLLYINNVELSQDGATHVFSLEPAGEIGSEVEVVLGLDRRALPNGASDLYAGVLRFTDDFGPAVADEESATTQIDVPVRAIKADQAGLWVGTALVNQVQEWLKDYDRHPEGHDMEGEPVSQETMVRGAKVDNYKVSVVSEQMSPTHREFPIRIIIHQNQLGRKHLFQRLYYGLNRSGKAVIATTEAPLDPARLASARRISSIHFPWTAQNSGWRLNGQFLPGVKMSSRHIIVTDFDDQGANPFLHTYHPDHDNLDDRDPNFDTPAKQGVESYTIERFLEIKFDKVPKNDFESVVFVGNELTGTYGETITIKGREIEGAEAGSEVESREFKVQGNLTLRRISGIKQRN